MFCSASCGPIVANSRSSDVIKHDGRRHRDAVVEGHQISRHRAAARVARAAQTRQDRSRDGSPGSRVHAGRPRSDSSPVAGRRARLRCLPWCARSFRASSVLPLRIKHLVPLSLADRVVAQNGHAVLCEQDAGALIAFVCLAVVTMAARQEYAGKRRRSFGNIEIGCHVVIGPALEDDLLDAITIAFELADDVRGSGEFARADRQGNAEESCAGLFCLLAMSSGVLMAAIALRLASNCCAPCR